MNGYMNWSVRGGSPAAPTTAAVSASYRGFSWDHNFNYGNAFNTLRLILADDVQAPAPETA